MWRATLNRNSQETVRKTQTLETKMKTPKLKHQKERSKSPSWPRTCKLLEMDLHPVLARHWPHWSGQESFVGSASEPGQKQT